MADDQVPSAASSATQTSAASGDQAPPEAPPASESSTHASDPGTVEQAALDPAVSALQDLQTVQGELDALMGENSPGEAAGAADLSAIDELLKQANFEDPHNLASAPPPTAEAQNIDLPNFQQVMREAQVSSIDLLRDVELNVKIELGRSRMMVEDVLKLGEGSVVELDKLAGDPVDVFVNDRLVARGEVLVLNDNFCVRVNEIVAGIKDEGL